MIKLLFVCLGNICRSPAAETIMNHMLKENNLGDQAICHSVGLTTTFFGQGADETMRELANERDYHITTTARPITELDFEQADFILAMNEEILTELRIMTPRNADIKKLHNLCDFCQYHPEDEIPDPYCGANEEFEFVLDMLEDACRGLIEMIKKTLN